MVSGTFLAFVSYLFTTTQSVDEGLLVVVAMVLSLAYGAHDLGVVRLPAPQLRRQVSQTWAHVLPPTAYGLIYGFLLGLGVTTYLYVATIYPAVVFSVTTSVTTAAAVAVAYGVGRVLPLAAAMVASPWLRADVNDAVEWLDAARPHVRPVAGYVLVGGAAFFAVAMASL